jgi:glycosyltransferase involved in cell wall biosynthesis
VKRGRRGGASGGQADLDKVICMEGGFSVVIPARNAERTLARVLHALVAQDPPPSEVIVVDDGSADRTAAIARQHGARLVSTGGNRSAGGARNLGWEAATAATVVFLDSDAIPNEGWTRGLVRAIDEFQGAIVGSARTFTGETRWEWVAHLQIETPYLPRGRPRDVPFVSSYCMVVPRDVPFRWDESYGGEDAIFCFDARASGIRVMFDPRFHALHAHGRTTFRQLRKQQDRLAYGLARCGVMQQEGMLKRFLSRFPIHYFALARLAVIYSRVNADRELRRTFLRLLPLLVVAEWALGLNAVRYAWRRPPLRAGARAGVLVSQADR